MDNESDRTEEIGYRAKENRCVLPRMKSSVSMCNVSEDFHKDGSEVSNGSDGGKQFNDEVCSDSESNKEHGVHSDEEDGEISVGCPSPVNDCYYKDDMISNSLNPSDCLEIRGSLSKSFSDEDGRSSRSSSASTCRRRCSLDDMEDNYDNYNKEDYFKPLKKLKMMQIDKMKFGISEKQNIQKIRPNKLAHSFKEIPNVLTTNSNNNVVEDLSSKSSTNGVKSFSILDILNHHPKNQNSAKDKQTETTITPAQPARIVRPWDIDDPASSSASSYNLPPPAHCGVFGLASPMLLDPRYHRLHLRTDVRPKSVDFCSTYESCSSGRSSAGGSDCCTSPDIINCAASPTSTSSGHQPRRSSGQQHQSTTPSTRKHQSSHSSGVKSPSPLDALVKLTSKPFEEIKSEPGTDGQPNPLNLFNNRQQAKKKRKSRTAFTNTQIFELERRFIHQKYLSPADRDEIAYQLRLTNAQVITWFQNRRAKLKRDLEELRKDVHATQSQSEHSSFLENAQNLSLLKKKPVVNHSSQESLTVKDK